MSHDRFRRERALWPAAVARDIDDEIAAHLEERREEFVAVGLDEHQAAAAAEMKFGNRDAVADICRRIDRGAHDHERRLHMLTDLRQDAGYAVRQFRRSPGFAAAAIATLALGMGATTTMFTLANWALLRPVPGVADPGQVSVVWVGTPSSRGGFSVSNLTYPNLADISSRVKTITIGAYQGGDAPVAGGGQAARNLVLQHVTASYFDVLGVRMQMGRPFSAAEDTPPSPVLGAVISDRLWQTMFQRRADVLAQTLDVAGVRFAILGVAPREFHGTERLSTTDLWLPGSSYPIVRHMPALRYDQRSGPGFYELVARLKPGATWAAASGELESMRAWLREQHPLDNGKFDRVGFHLMGPIGPHPLGRSMMQKVVGWTAFGASAIVLLIACANVAGLLTIRAFRRRHETAVRKALGAGRGRLLRQHVAEGVLLWIAGGAAALVMLLTLRRSIDIAALMGMGAIDRLPPIDWRVLAFTAAVSLAVGLVFSIIPAIRDTRAEAADVLRASHAVTVRRFVGTSLAVLQVGAALTLLVGALLLAATLRHLAAVPLGFEPAGVYAFFLTPTAVGYGEAESHAYIEEFARRLRVIAGVQSVTAGRAAPFLGSGFIRRIKSTDTDPRARRFETNSVYVFDTGYFSTLRIPVQRGRTFTDADLAAGMRGESRAIVLSEQLARRLFGTADPIGRGVEFADQAGSPRFDVIGVVGTARYSGLLGEPGDVFYEPATASSARRDAVMIVRAGDRVRVSDEARRIATALNPALPLTLVQSMDASIARARQDWDSLGRLLAILAVLAAVLSSVGLYGVVAHGVAERRREFGIRAALGASRSDVWRLVLRQSATIVGAGVACGLVGAYAFAQTLSTRLVGVTPLDVRVWTHAVVLLAAVALVASLRPAMAAGRVDVNETLRTL